MRRSARERIAVLGAGKLGECIIGGLLQSRREDPPSLTATARHAARLEQLASKYKVATTLSNRAAVSGAGLILLAVKPQVMEEVLADIRPAVRRGQLVLSVAASVPTAFIEKRLAAGVAVVRAMPNTPCVVGHGMTVLSAGRHAREEHLEAARGIFAPLGLCLTLDEKHMDAVTALSASGPAYLYVVIESLAEGGVKVGLPREVATTLVAQMALGSAAMVLKTGEHPALLKDAVTTPAGCTIDGLLALEEGGLRVALIRAVVRATRRAGELLHG